MPNTHIPVRCCLGCGERLPKDKLIRILRTPEGNILLDREHNQNGRGAYLCGSAVCTKRVRKSRRIETVLGAVIPEEIWTVIEAEGQEQTKQ